MCVYKYLHEFMCVHVPREAKRGVRSHVTGVVSHLEWVLGTQLRSSAGAARTPNH